MGRSRYIMYPLTPNTYQLDILKTVNNRLNTCKDFFNCTETFNMMMNLLTLIPIN